MKYIQPQLIKPVSEAAVRTDSLVSASGCEAAELQRGTVKLNNKELLNMNRIKPCPAAGCCWLGGWLPYRDRMESLDKSFFFSTLLLLEEEEVVGVSTWGGAALEPDCREKTVGGGSYIMKHVQYHPTQLVLKQSGFPVMN